MGIQCWFGICKQRAGQFPPDTTKTLLFAFENVLSRGKEKTTFLNLASVLCPVFSTHAQLTPPLILKLIQLLASFIKSSSTDFVNYVTLSLAYRYQNSNGFIVRAGLTANGVQHSDSKTEMWGFQPFVAVGYSF